MLFRNFSLRQQHKCSQFEILFPKKCSLRGRTTSEQNTVHLSCFCWQIPTFSHVIRNIKWSSVRRSKKEKKKKSLFGKGGGYTQSVVEGGLQETGAVFRFSKFFEVFNRANLKFEKS
jgi:hypothetical protein